jgi:predicted RNase H-like nuclease
MPVVLGIDAAWTAKEPSGVSLLSEQDGRWTCLAVAPSYGSFLEFAAGHAVDWTRPRYPGSSPDAKALLDASRELARSEVDLVAVDMPVSRPPITERRAADREISRKFGGRGCSTHSPSAVRPGPISDQLTQDFSSAGYMLATSNVAYSPGQRVLIEVYPHPALLSLLDRNFRVPYKVSKSRKLWPGSSVSERVKNLLREFDLIYCALQDRFGGLGFELPAPPTVPRLSHLKRFEDALDALVCGWVGAEFTRLATRPYGDEAAAIWVPMGRHEIGTLNL